jgi:hypothetical protein
MDWRRVWVITAVRDDQLARIQKIATTAAELRSLLNTARADKTVWHISYTSRRELVGEKPTHCACGHPYRTAGTLATPHDWLDCVCGGHHWWSCRDCGEERIEPPVAYDCRPHMPSQ